MNTQLLITFIIFNIINVITQTVKSVVTIKCSKGIAAIVNALAYGLYTYIVVLMVCELPLWAKVIIVGGCNLVGVYVVKLIEEKMQKDKLWLVKITIPDNNHSFVDIALTTNHIPFSAIKTVNYTVFDCYCATKAETAIVVDICKNNNGKMFATENKLFN